MKLPNAIREIGHIGYGLFIRMMSDETYIKWAYHRRLGRYPDLQNPKKFTEKEQWLKLNDRNPEYITMVDKAAAKDYVAAIIGKEHIIPTYGVWDRFEDIDFEMLPDQFVMKCTHDSGGLIICRDKKKLDWKAAEKKLKRCLKKEYFYYGREWPYKGVPHRIIAEKYMQTDGQADLIDYKLFCFNGEPRAILTVRGGHEDENNVIRRMYDQQWNLLPVGLHHKPPITEAEEKPEQLEELLTYARKLSNGYPFLRTDFYIIDGTVYFGELTLFHMGGCESFSPESWDDTFGSWLKLPIDE